jgi:hypothetical protein
MVHYHEERNHQGLDNDLIGRLPARSAAPGLLRYYYQAA